MKKKLRYVNKISVDPLYCNIILLLPQLVTPTNTHAFKQFCSPIEKEEKIPCYYYFFVNILCVSVLIPVWVVFQKKMISLICIEKSGNRVTSLAINIFVLLLLAQQRLAVLVKILHHHHRHTCCSLLHIHVVPRLLQLGISLLHWYITLANVRVASCWNKSFYPMMVYMRCWFLLYWYWMMIR